MRAAVMALLGVSGGLLMAQDAKIHAPVVESGKSPVEASFVSAGRVKMELCSSAVELIGRSDERLRVSYDTRYGSEVRVRIDILGNNADLRVSGCPHNNFQMTIEVPKASDLHVRMFAGQMDVWGVTGDKDVSLSAGQLTMEVGKPEDYVHVEASVSSGDLEASAFDVSKGGLFRSFDKTGPGKYQLHAHGGAGQLELR